MNIIRVPRFWFSLYKGPCHEVAPNLGNSNFGLHVLGSVGGGPTYPFLHLTHIFRKPGNDDDEGGANSQLRPALQAACRHEAGRRNSNM